MFITNLDLVELTAIPLSSPFAMTTQFSFWVTTKNIKNTGTTIFIFKIKIANLRVLRVLRGEFQSLIWS